MKDKSLLVLCGGQEAVPAIIRAKELGLRVYVCDGNPDAIGKQYCDVFLHADIYNAQAVVDVIKYNNLKGVIDGVITVAADNPVSVALACLELGIDRSNLTAANVSTNKLKMKEVMLEAGINVPDFYSVNSLNELIQIVGQKPVDFVLKPIDSRGSRGVIRIKSIDECFFSYNYASQYTKKEYLILEHWIDGYQLSSESIVWNGKSYLCGLADRNYDRLDELYPYVVEDGGQTPSVISNDMVIEQINNIIDKICLKLGIKEGVIKGDLILKEGIIYVVEFAYRLSGGGFSTITIPNVYNYSLIDNAIKICLNIKPNLPNKSLEPAKYQINRFFFFKPGRVKSINIPEFKNIDIIDFNINVSEGDLILPITNHTKRHGYINVCSNNRETALNLLKSTMNSIHIVYE